MYYEVKHFCFLLVPVSIHASQNGIMARRTAITNFPFIKFCIQRQYLKIDALGK